MLVIKTELKTSRGFPLPFGTAKYPKGINFAIFSKRATAISLCFFKPNESKPFIEIPLNPKTNKTGDVWHIFVYDLPSNYEYGYRVDGPYEPDKGHYFDNRIIVSDPYTKQIVSSHEWGSSPQKDLATIHKGVVYPLDPFNWEEDTHPNIPMSELVIYEMHVRAFTQDPSSGVQERGTFAGIIEKIPYLKSLGINAVELLPIHEFNERGTTLHDPETGELLFNFWGYMTTNFFTPMTKYGSGKENTLIEFKKLVKALHAEGIEVILDVVYNHTGEGGKEGPTLSFKGLENSEYYMTTPNGEYYNFSGCGNTFNCNNPVVREFIRDNLRYWVTEMHVDGFRFDLASILTRGQDGTPLANPPLVEALSLDPILANTKLIAEAWDAAGLYQVGAFPGLGVWSEWNGKYRDGIRRFIKGTDGAIGEFTTRLSGSEDLYGGERLPIHSVNFVTSHDGFSLADLVSYNEKHNEMNGEENRDGDNNNESWNCGVEGPTDDPAILALRLRQMKNFMTALLISQGVPMMTMGDEYGHSKQGNNNTWGHDSRLNWFQWDALEEGKDLFTFVQKMIAFRKEHPVITRSRFFTEGDIVWHGVEPKNPDWSHTSRFIAYLLPDLLSHYSLYIAFNAYYEEITAHLPWREAPWKKLVDTALPSPNDCGSEEEAPELGKTLTIAPYSAAILISRENH